jgi:hypothetical protein
VGGIELRLARLKGLQAQAVVAYTDLFDALLVAEGVRYDSFTGRFSAQRWDVARLLDMPEQVRARAERLLFVLQWLPLVFGVAVFALLFVSLYTLGWLAVILIHCATIPTLLALLTGLSDNVPNLDIVLFMWGGLALLFFRAVVMRDLLNIITIGLGFITQAVIMAMILFK